MNTLEELVRSSDWMVRVLTIVRDAEIPDAWVGAGALRDLVWGELYGSGFEPGAVRDVDVPFFDPHDLSRANDDRVTDRLRGRWPEAPFGLGDLLGGVWRRNPRRVSLDHSLARLARHRPAQRWPGVTVIPPG